MSTPKNNFDGNMFDPFFRCSQRIHSPEHGAGDHLPLATRNFCKKVTHMSKLPPYEYVVDTNFSPSAALFTVDVSPIDFH